MRKKIILWTCLSIVSILLYITVWMVSQLDVIKFSLSDPDRSALFLEMMGQILSRRSIQVIALVIASVLIAISTTVFQTLTQNRIITPSLLGFDSIYVVTQTTLVYFFSTTNFIVDPVLNFILSVSLMTTVTLLMYQTILNRHKNNILLLLLIGMVISTLASNYANFLQILMHPTDFQTLMSLTSVSVVNIHTTLTWIALPITIILVIYFYYKNHVLDVMALGQHHAQNLGINYNRETHKNLVAISIAISLTTALVVPLSFLGLIAVNIAKEHYQKYHHKMVFTLASLVALTILIFGQSMVELLGFKTLVTTLISFGGGMYMIYLIIKEHRT